jgi:transcriptional regulator with XRE-family HTH domain
MTYPNSEVGFHIQYLKTQLQDSRSRNPRYSLRAFARRLGVNVATVSKIIRGIENPSVSTSKRILDALAATPQDRAQFMDSVFSKRAVGLDESLKSFSFAIDLTKPEATDQIVANFISGMLDAIPNDEKSNRHIVRIVLFPESSTGKT